MALGIETIKTDVLFLVDTATKVKAAIASKFSYLDDIAILANFSQLPGILAKKDELLAEIKDLTVAEENELIAFIESNLNIPNLRTKAIIFAALELVPSIFNLVEAFKTEVPEAPAPTA